MKIFHKLLLSFLVFVLLIWLVGYLAVSTSQDTLKTQIGKSSVSLAVEILAEIEKSINSKIELFQEYCTDLILQQAVSESNQEFDELDNIQAYINKKDQEWTSVSKETTTPFMQKLISSKLSEELREKTEFYDRKHGHRVFGEVFVTNKYGANVAQTGKTTDYRQDDEQWWQKAKRDGLCVADIEYDESANVYSIDSGIRIDDQNGTFIGVMKVVLSVEEVNDIIERIGETIEYETAEVHLVNREGEVISSTHHALREDLPDKQFLTKIDNDSGYFEGVGHGRDKADVLLSYAVSKGYRTFRGLGWILFIEHRTGEIFMPVTEMRNNILVISMIVTLLALLISFFISRRISVPIARLEQAVVEIGKGELFAEIGVETGDEIGQLTGSFKKMTEDLKKSTTSIDHLNKEIAERERAEEELQISYQAQTILNELLHLSLEDISMKELLEVFIKKITSIPWFELESQGGVFLVEDEPEVLVLRAQQGLDTRIQTKCSRVPFGKCLCGRAALSGEIEFADCVGESHEIRFEGMTPHGHYCVPILSADKVLGVITLYVKEGHSRNEMEEEFLYAVCDVLAGIIERKQTEEVLQKRTHDLGERVKELNCLYGISDLVVKPGVSLEAILQGTIDLIPPSWQYPEITCARVILEDQEFRTKNFQETIWKQASDIIVHGDPIGTLEVFCLEQKRESDEGPFMQEERLLLDNIADRLTRIIERKQAQQKLRQSENKYRMLLENLPQKIFHKDRDSVYVSCNENFARDLKIKSVEIKGKTDHDFFPKELAEKYKADDNRIMMSGKTENIEEKYLQDGKEVWVHTVKTPIRDKDSTVTGILGMFWDITEQKQAEQEKKALQSQILQSEKMASIGQLAAGVAHEINNPTGFISSNLNTLAGYDKDVRSLIAQYSDFTAGLRDAMAAEKGRASISKNLDRIVGLEKEIDIDFILDDSPNLIRECQEGAERIKNIVIDLKNFAHPGEDELSFADINKGLDSTLNVAWNELKYKATVTKDYGDLPEVQCYPQQLNQVFLNLLVNAAQAIEQQGEIKIRTSALDGKVEIKISDTGGGIPEENLSNIFDPFFTTKDVGKGTGLGLNVAYNIIKKHKGTIDVESTVGKGTTFTIRIPVTSNQHPEV